ncbi:MAG: 2Fe-2S iron-sulfur cluster binding domain-containing protein [Proteobacteria bacterium]|nr:2Fe-2S iron-sulfur cluster binding domain-containing protein [Pseudomonadota bacterium]
MFKLFGSTNKDRQADINSGEHQFTVKAGDNLLNAALELGIPWPHDCRVGSCTSCKCILKKGKTKSLTDFTYVLDPDQLKEGWILACQTRLKTDIEVEVELEDASHAHQVVSFEGQLARVTDLTHDIKEIVVQSLYPLPQRSGIAGQYAEISVPGLSSPRSYSFAKAPENEAENEMTFFVRLVPGGEFTEWLFKEDRTDAKVTVAGPYGHFWLRPEPAPIVCIAGGSGISSIKAILESAVNEQITRDCLFLFGARTQKDLYCLAEMEEIGSKWNPSHSFEFVPVLNMEPEDSDWQGARGLVTDYLQSAYVDTGKLSLSESQGYLCGPPPMIDAAIEVMVAQGMKEENIFFDKFLDASTMPGGRGAD